MSDLSNRLKQIDLTHHGVGCDRGLLGMTECRGKIKSVVIYAYLCRAHAVTMVTRPRPQCIYKPYIPGAAGPIPNVAGVTVHNQYCVYSYSNDIVFLKFNDSK